MDLSEFFEELCGLYDVQKKKEEEEEEKALQRLYEIENQKKD